MLPKFKLSAAMLV